MPPPSTVPPRKRKALDAADEGVAGPSRSPSSSASGDLDGEEEADGEYEPSPVPSARGGRGGKRVGAGGAKGGGKSVNGRPMSREALRKANHSLIERRRREKINAALGDLREMVPGLGDGMGKGGEFKLEVLERTVGYMRQLRQQVVDLEAQLGVPPSMAGVKPSREYRAPSKAHPPPPTASAAPAKARSPTTSKSHTTSGSPPTPTPSDSHSDPNETDAEQSLPPQFAMAHRSPPAPTPSAPSIASLLSGAVRPPPAPASRPLAPPQAANPTLYLPFPTPSPTSPFLTYSGASSSSTGAVTEPSPFLAPIQSMGLFGGVLNLDTPEGEAVGTKGQDPSTEEAANLLLAFSSPDTLRPSPGNAIPMAMNGGRERRSTLESEEFVLDGNGSHERIAIRVDARTGSVAGKTARDILRM